MPSILIAFFLLLCQVLPLYSLANSTLTVAFNNTPPRMIHESQSGIYHELFDHLAMETGFNFNIVYYPMARIENEFTSGYIDIEPGIAPEWRADSTEPGLYTEPFSKLTDLVLFQPGLKQALCDREHWPDLTLGIVRGYQFSYLHPCIKDKDFRYVYLIDEEKLLSFFIKGRVDVIFIDEFVFHYLSDDLIALEKDLSNWDVLQEVEISLRVHPNNKQLMPNLNNAIHRLKTKGTLDSINNKYKSL